MLLFWSEPTSISYCQSNIETLTDGFFVCCVLYSFVCFVLFCFSFLLVCFVLFVLLCFFLFVFLQIPSSFLCKATPCRILSFAAFCKARNREIFHGNNQVIMKVGFGACSLMGIIPHEQYP